MSEQTVTKERKPRSPNGPAKFLVQAKDGEGWVDLGTMDVPSGTRRTPDRKGDSVLDLAVRQFPDKFPEGEAVVIRAIRAREPDKDFQEHTITIRTERRAAIG